MNHDFQNVALSRTGTPVNSETVNLQESPSSMGMRNGHAETSSEESNNGDSQVDSALWLLRDILQSVLTKIRNQKNLYQFYTTAREQCLSYSQSPGHVSVDPDSIFKNLMAYPTEVLSAIYIPVTIRFLDWANATHRIPAQCTSGRGIVTSKRCLGFLKDDSNVLSHTSGTAQRIVEGLKLLQRLQMIIFPEKPVFYNDPGDDQALDSAWQPLESREVYEFLESLSSHRNELEMSPTSPSSVTSMNPPRSSISRRGNLYPQLAPSPHATSLPPNVPMPSLAFEPLHPSSITDQRNADLLNPHVAFPSQQTLTNSDLDMKLAPIFNQIIPDMEQRLHYLALENKSLREQNMVLLQNVSSLESQIAQLQNFVSVVVSKPTGATSLGLQPQEPRQARKKIGKVKQQRTSPTQMSATPNQAPLAQIDQIVPKQPSTLNTASSNLHDLQFANPTDHRMSEYDTMLHGYDPLMVRSSELGRSSNGLINSTQEPTFELHSANPLIIQEGQSRILSYQNTPDPQSRSTLQQQQQQQLRYTESKKARPKYKDTPGSQLSKGKTYHPPVSITGKNYLVDEDGRLAIVMSNDQDSIYSIYNEFYQSLKPQVESFVKDFGKSRLVQFKKKRTFQKKKAFVYLAEKIAYMQNMPVETVLGIIDQIRHREEKSVVWACNNLNLLKDMLVKHRPDLRDTVFSDTE